LAADYLVMAAWLAYLKSRLLLPEPPKGEEPSASDLATALALRLRRLEAIREAAKRMSERHQLGRDVFARGWPEPIEIRREPIWEATLYDLLSAYARQRQTRLSAQAMTLPQRHVWSLVDAREALQRLVGEARDWTNLDGYLLRYMVQPEMRPTVLASAFSATLEMVREGRLVVRQDEPFAPIWVRSRGDTPAGAEA
jgi:segregation and condensation protein A